MLYQQDSSDYTKGVKAVIPRTDNAMIKGKKTLIMFDKIQHKQLKIDQNYARIH